MNESRPTTARFRFTIRELLLAMVAVGALAALAIKSYEKAQPFAPTAFFKSFDALKAEEIVSRIGKQLSVDVHPLGPSGGRSAGGTSASREIRLKLGEGVEDPTGIVVAFRSEVEDLLAERGCDVLSSRSASEGTKQNVTHFSFEYEQGTSRGHVFVHRIPTTAGYWQLFVLVHEFRR